MSNARSKFAFFHRATITIPLAEPILREEAATITPILTEATIIPMTMVLLITIMDLVVLPTLLQVVQRSHPPLDPPLEPPLDLEEENESLTRRCSMCWMVVNICCYCTEYFHFAAMASISVMEK